MIQDHTTPGADKGTFRRRALLTLMIAAALTLILAPLMNSVGVGTWGGADFLGLRFGVTVYINSYLGIGSGDNGMGPDPEDYADPQIARYLSTVKARLQPYLGKPGSSYEVWMIVPQYCAQGWPWQTRAKCAKIVVDEYAAGQLQQHVVLADRNGDAPERPGGILANWLFYAAISLPLSWLLVRFTPIHQVRFNPAVLRAPAIALLHIERRWHWGFIAASTLLLGFMGACYTHTNVFTYKRAPFTGQFDDVYLNAMMGLPSDYLPEELDPLSGITPADPQLIAFCEKLAEQARPYVKGHPDQCTVWVMLTSHAVCGWPFRSSIAVATLNINDESSGGSYGLEYEFEVDAEGNPAFKWLGAMGNTLIFAAAAFPFAWGLFALIAWILDRLTRLPPAFPVVITNDEQAKEEV